MSRNTVSKYRPSLTQEQIVHLISLCRKDSSDESLRIIGLLAQFEFKIKQGAIVQSHAVDVKQGLAVDLGFADPAIHMQGGARSANLILELWNSNPAQLSVLELQRVRSYRYENDLMTPEEQLSYENEILGIITDGA